MLVLKTLENIQGKISYSNNIQILYLILIGVKYA